MTRDDRAGRIVDEHQIASAKQIKQAGGAAQEHAPTVAIRLAPVTPPAEASIEASI